MSDRHRTFGGAVGHEFRRRLLDTRAALFRTVEATDEEIAALGSPGPGDASDRAGSAAITLLVTRLGGQEKRELDEISDALGRLENGRFGECASCHKPIPLARLRALPATRFCRRCQGAREVVR